MKIKYTAIVALLVWLAVTGWLATMVIVKPAVLHLGNSADETQAMVELRNAIQRNQRAQAQIASLRQTVHIDDSRPLLALASAPPVGDSTAGSDGSAWTGVDARGEPIEHSVTMVLDTNGHRSAIVNGQRVRAGSRLGDGSRVRAIGTDSISIENPDGERVRLAVPSPFLQQSQARGGTR